METPYRSASFWGLVAGAALLSSLLGLHGFFLMVWSRSLVGDIVFIVATAAAFAVTSSMPNRLWPLTAIAGLGLHSLVYILGWRVSIGGKWSNMDMVFMIGSMGLAWCTVASPLLALRANRIRNSGAPPPNPQPVA